MIHFIDCELQWELLRGIMSCEKPIILAVCKLWGTKKSFKKFKCRQWTRISGKMEILGTAVSFIKSIKFSSRKQMSHKSFKSMLFFWWAIGPTLFGGIIGRIMNKWMIGFGVDGNLQSLLQIWRVLGLRSLVLEVILIKTSWSLKNDVNKNF